MTDFGPVPLAEMDCENLVRIYTELIVNEHPKLVDVEIEQAARFLNSGVIQQRLENARKLLRGIAQSQSDHYVLNSPSSEDELTIPSSDDELSECETELADIKQHSEEVIRKEEGSDDGWDTTNNEECDTPREVRQDEVERREREGTAENNDEYAEMDPQQSSFNETESVVTSSSVVCGNIPRVSFSSFISEKESFLMVNRESFPLLESVEISEFNYPLGVVFDEETKVWMICDLKNHKIVRIDVKDNSVRSLEHPLLRNPSAVTVLKDGISIAMLCSNTPRSEFSIYKYKLKDKLINTFATYNDPKYDMHGSFRGLARSFAGNLMSLESLPNGPRRLRVFSRRQGGAAFPLPGAMTPSFVASRGERVAVSDLGANQVYLLQVNDADFSRIEFSVLQKVQTEYARPDILCNRDGFLFAAGLQFDADGNILIGDAKGHTLKLYDGNLKFLHRVSSDFPLPYMSSFFVNEAGEMIILDIQSPKKFIFATMGSVHNVTEWIAPVRSNFSSRGGGNANRRRGGGGYKN